MTASLRVAVVQTARRHEFAETRNCILTGIEKAADCGARVVVFSEGALAGADSPAALDRAIDSIQRAASERKLYVVCGVSSRYARVRPSWNWLRPRYWANRLRGTRHVNWMFVIDPGGREIFRYVKLYDQHDATMPGVFHIDGVPCSAVICADRWLRGIEEIPIQQGAKLSIELSNNFSSEWIPEFQWNWCVPRALRNNVWVVFANSARQQLGQSDESRIGHGHSAVIAPDGTVVANALETEDMIVADLDIALATRSAAIARAAHPALTGFWSAGDALQRGAHVEAPRLGSLRSPPVSVTLAAAPIAGSCASAESAIATASSRGADLVAFPAGAVDEVEIDRIRGAARDSRITVAIGAVHREANRVFNSAFVIGPDGSVLTRYDQLSAEPPFTAGTSPASMWFSVKGVPAIVILERDALWTELVELSAVAGARIVIQLDRAVGSSDHARLMRLQSWSSLASFLTFTATVGADDASLWDNLRGMEQRRAENRRRPRPDTGQAVVYSPWSANLVARASSPSDLLVATRTIPAATNPHYPLRTARFNPQMDAWYRLGAALVRRGDSQESR